VSDITFTPAEARVLFTVLSNTWPPMYGHTEFMSAVKKLGHLGGGYCCRDCSDPGTHASRLGGFLCGKHKDAELARVG
jgi:hypothetical protein